jgi:hypothetical protein
MGRQLALLFLIFPLTACATLGSRTPSGRTQPVTHSADPRTEQAIDRHRSAGNPLTIRLSAYVVPEPAEIRVETRVEPDPRSRELTIEWWSEDGTGGSHLISLEGDRSSARNDYPIKRLSAGEYVVTAILERNDGSSVRREARVLVVGEGARLPVNPRGDTTGDLLLTK